MRLRVASDARSRQWWHPMSVRQLRLDRRQPGERDQRQPGEDQEARATGCRSAAWRGRATRRGRSRRRRRRSRPARSCTPISLPKRCGTSWNTAPLPKPSVPMTSRNSATATAKRWPEPVADHGERCGSEQIDARQRPDPADPVGHRAADRPHQRADEDAAGGAIAGDDRGQVELVGEIDRQTKADRPTKPPKVTP